MPSSAQSIFGGRQESLACAVGRDGNPAQSYLRLRKVLLAIPRNMWSSAPCQRDSPMSKSLAFTTASHPARHAAASPCAVLRRIAVCCGLPGVLLSHPTGPLPRSSGKATTGNVGNAANLIFLRHPPATPSKG
jgi:hypothetical protein